MGAGQDWLPFGSTKGGMTGLAAPGSATEKYIG